MVKKVPLSQLNVPGSQMSFIYDISDPVGRVKGNCPNSPDDVALLQFLLDEVFRSNAHRPLGKMAIDGAFGPMTHYWLLYFKCFYEREKQTTLVDQPDFFATARGNHVGPVTSTVVFQLNRLIWQRNPAGFEKLETDNSKFPPAVKAKLAHRAAKAAVEADRGLNLALKGR